MKRQIYPTDLTDAEWQLIELLLPPAKSGGRPRTTNLREMLNAIFYLLRTGSRAANAAAGISTLANRLFLFGDDKADVGAVDQSGSSRLILFKHPLCQTALLFPEILKPSLLRQAVSSSPPKPFCAQ